MVRNGATFFINILKILQKYIKTCILIGRNTKNSKSSGLYAIETDKADLYGFSNGRSISMLTSWSMLMSSIAFFGRHGISSHVSQKSARVTKTVSFSSTQPWALHL